MEAGFSLIQKYGKSETKFRESIVYYDESTFEVEIIYPIMANTICITNKQKLQLNINFIS